MSELTHKSNTGTAKYQVDVGPGSYARTALEVHVLTMKTRDVQDQVKILTDPPCAAWFSEQEISDLRRLWNVIAAAGDVTAEWERAWRARLVSSQKS